MATREGLMGPQPEGLPHLSLQSKQNNGKNQPLSVFVLDCCPFYVYAPYKNIVGAPTGSRYHLPKKNQRNKSKFDTFSTILFFPPKTSTKDDGPTIRWRLMGASWWNTLIKVVHWLEEDMLLTSERKIASHMHGRIVIKDGFHTTIPVFVLKAICDDNQF